MEMININDIKEFKDHKVVKKVPILSNNLMGSLLFIGSDTQMLPVRTKGSKEMHLVLDGSGSIEMGEETQTIGPGDLMLVPSNSRYHYSTSDDEMTVLVVRMVDCGQAEKKEEGDIADFGGNRIS